MNGERNKLLTGKTEMRGNLIKKLRDPGEAIEEIYPRKLWESRFKRG